MEIKTLLKEAFLRGMAWDPSTPELAHIDLTSINKMTGREKHAQALIRALQRSDAKYPYIVESIHGRAKPDYDGLPGPATYALLKVPRCPMPDHPPPIGARFYYPNPTLQKSVESMQQVSATGSGSWQKGCHGDAKVHEVTVSYDLSNLSAKQKEWMPQIKAHNSMAVGAMGLRIIEVPVGEKAMVRFFGKSYGGSTIGMAQFNNGSCTHSVFCTISPRYAPNLRMVLILVMHEFGHTMNFSHSRGFIMNSSILDVPEFWVRRDSSGAIIYKDVRYADGTKYFDGNPITPPAPMPSVVTVDDFLAI